ncbi:adenylyltransferase/cytidyltransferase family protein [Candidatus Daviesbacteria bacterium]|nr:adenylyltransferase/cytidyltransferase family protein [Candidatus Daviesbacteria bacterium]
MSKILKLVQASKLFGDQRNDQSIVLVGGCFDILHVGHIDFLNNAKRLGDILVVILEHDQNIKKKKGEGRPINTQKDRAQVLSHLQMVNFVICLPQMKENNDYDRIVSLIKPHIIATTKGDPNIHHKKRVAKLVGAKLKIANKLLKEYSSSKYLK